jgi:hypothetical protein
LGYRKEKDGRWGEVVLKVWGRDEAEADTLMKLQCKNKVAVVQNDRGRRESRNTAAQQRQLSPSLHELHYNLPYHRASQ